MSMIEYTVDRAVAIIRLNRPPVNAISEEFAAEVLESMERAADPAVRAVVLFGEPHFAAGADIKAFLALHEAHERGDVQEVDPAGTVVAAVRAMETLPKPVIAAIKGFALGGGLELAMGADFRFAGESSKVGQPEILLGLMPGAGGTQRLTRLIGLQRARELNYSGRHVGADEALALGILDKVFPDDEVIEAAIAQAVQYATGPTRAIGAIKRAMNEGFGRPIDAAMEIEVAAFKDLFFSDDAKEGMAAFVEKRKPDFSGS